ncbi:MFS transporter [Aeromicrobium phragmitis]|uniref:MFS transporter n=1 Tax=Aeromicrobium phragmitis TaxID=2478914 RepID=A0A3L8PQ09_9ACTN|nr:MFS transporter [Aeromicrobium phragmitis]RLV57495.1 MFS transporter [Aeromicrobium phragmitis]
MTAGRATHPALLGLCLVEFSSWGVLYYTLPVLGVTITNATGWPVLVVPTVYTLGLLLAAALAPLAGRWVDHLGPKRVMAAGSLLGAAGVALSTVGPSLLMFAAGWCCVGVAQAATLYPPAFSAANQWFGAGGWPLTVITLAGGVSSTALAPVIAGLGDELGWRRALLVLAAGYAVVSTSAAVGLLRPRWRRPERRGREHRTYVAAIGRSPAFRSSRQALAVAALGLYAVTLTLIPLLTERGLGYREAAMVFGLVGTGQVLGRLAFHPLSRFGDPRSRLLVQVAASATVIAILGVVRGPLHALAIAAVLAGAVRGAHTLAAASAVSDRWGSEAYATILGRFHAPIAAAMALGPAAGSALAHLTGSYGTAALVFSVLTLLAVVLVRKA